MKIKIIAVDFDGTIIKNVFPSDEKKNVPLAFETLKDFQSLGHKLILWTARDGAYLKGAVDHCESNGVIFWGINENPEQKRLNNSPKVRADIIIDDSALGCPLIYPGGSEKPYVDWGTIRKAFKL